MRLQPAIRGHKCLGHTCVLSGKASLDELVKLAAWAGGGEVPF
jgi:hypothetical protein